MRKRGKPCFCLYRHDAVDKEETIIKNRAHQINEEIKDQEVRVVGEDGSQLGVMSIKEAQKAANSKNLDLVKIAPQAVPPVCRIMDYGKFRFEQAKKEKEAKKNQHVVEVKEIQLHLKTDTHDLNTKINAAIKFLQSGDKVKVVLKMRGREMNHQSMAVEFMQKCAEMLSEHGTVEKASKFEGRNVIMFVAPKTGTK